MLLLGVISKIKQNSNDMNEIILVPCDAGYVQNCTGFVLFTTVYYQPWSVYHTPARPVIVMLQGCIYTLLFQKYKKL
jgi:hypothetical protein